MKGWVFRTYEQSAYSISHFYGFLSQLFFAPCHEKPDSHLRLHWIQCRLHGLRPHQSPTSSLSRVGQHRPFRIPSRTSRRFMFLSCSLSAMSGHVFEIPLRIRFGFRFDQRVLNHGPCPSGPPVIDFACGEEYGGIRWGFV